MKLPGERPRSAEEKSFVSLTLSHGQSDVGSGFSINLKTELENLKEDNLVALKIVFSELQSKPDFVDYFITPGLLQSCKVD